MSLLQTDAKGGKAAEKEEDGLNRQKLQLSRQMISTLQKILVSKIKKIKKEKSRRLKTTQPKQAAILGLSNEKVQ